MGRVTGWRHPNNQLSAPSEQKTSRSDHSAFTQTIHAPTLPTTVSSPICRDLASRDYTGLLDLLVDLFQGYVHIISDSRR